MGIDTSDPVPDADGMYSGPMKAMFGGRFRTDKRLTHDEYNSRRTGIPASCRAVAP